MPAGETPRNLMNVPFQSFFWSSLRMTEDTWGARVSARQSQRLLAGGALLLRSSQKASLPSSDHRTKAFGTRTTIQLAGAMAWRPDPSVSLGINLG